MAVDLLDAPLRITWDLCPEGHIPLGEAQVSEIVATLVEAGVFFVTLEESPLRHPQIHAVIKGLIDGGCQVALVFHGQEPEWRQLQGLPEGLTLFLDCRRFMMTRGLDQTALQHAVENLRQRGIEPALMWMPRHQQLLYLPELLRFCTRMKLTHFKLPNSKINANSVPAQVAGLLQSDDLEILKKKLHEQVGAGELPAQLEIHDLFLWELLQGAGGSRTEYGGCQAANSLGHIAANGDLLPCSSWPEPLGNLAHNSLLDLWQVPRRFEIREEIARVPLGCQGCRDYEICFGGCRGLVRFCRQDGLERDLLCKDIRLQDC